jgi:2-polyprenyl-3-methyl-5-hydroxy-6-metoxy-1,4-benzoquinol methylase/ribosomal protein S27E
MVLYSIMLSNRLKKIVMSLDIKLKGEFLDVHCPTCGPNTQRKSIFERRDGITFYSCLQCNIEYASPRLVESSLLNLYEGDAWRNKLYYENWTYENWKQEKGKDYFLVQENLKLVKFFLESGSSILDVGCDIGLTVRALEESGYYSEGVEVSKIGSKIAKEKTKIKVQNVKLENFQSDNLFDGVLLLDVLEHLNSPIQVLTECSDNLKQGGYIFLHTPHHRGLGTRYKKFLHKKGFKKDYKHFGFPEHIYSFDKKSLKAMLLKAGFATIHFESWPNQLTRGKINIVNYLMVKLIKFFSLSDYIVCVARKN